MILPLSRTASTELATSGTLLAADSLFHTIEQPWRNNLKGHSCVPVGTYDLIPYQSPRHGATWQLHNPALNIYGRGNVPEGGRSACEIHSANWAEQLEGCIALGLDDKPMFDPLTGKVEPSIEGSRDAVAHLHAILGEMSHGHTLVISEQGVPT